MNQIFVDSFDDEDDDVMLPSKSSDELGQTKSPETMSLTSSLKRGLRLRDQQDTLSLSGTLKRGFRKHVLKSADSVLSLSSEHQISPRNSTKFVFKSPRKGQKNVNNEQAVNYRGSKVIKDNKSNRASGLRVYDVAPNSSPFDDTVSMIEGLLVDTVPISHQEGIRDSIGRKNVVTLKKMVKLERPQGDRTDAKVLVLTPYRCQLLGVKAPFKLEHDFHFLDIKSLDSPSPQRLVISTSNGKIFFMQMIGTDDADHIIGRVALSLRTIFPNVALSRILKASLEPLGRQKLIQTMLNQADQIEPGPCGNFSEMYRCICDYLNVPNREDVEWDVNTIYLSQDCREINLKDFDLLEIKDIIPVISVMVYNRWFHSLVIRDVKLTGDVLDFVLKVARNSHNFKELSLEGAALKSDFAQRLSMNLVDNRESCLEVLDLSNNPLEDKGLLHMSGALPLIKHGSVKRLNFSKTGLTPRGINGLCQSLRSSPKILESLTHLNLSGNLIRGEEAEELIHLLSNHNSITDLEISATDCSVEVYVSTLSKTCINHLENLSIGKNHFYGRKRKEGALQSGFQQFFEQASALKRVDFSNMKLPAEALGRMLDGLQNNKNKGLAVEINLTCCELKSPGCQVLQSHMTSMKNVIKLDLTDNGFDSDIIPLLNAMQDNKSLKELSIGKNFLGIKTKALKRTMEAIVELIQEEDSILESLSLADSRIREAINTVLGCLGSNTSLTTLDISGNSMCDGGSRVLAKSIQINSKLKIIKFDRNNLTALGFEEIANAMEKNFALRHIPYPVSDAVIAMKYHPERTQSALSQIQDLLLRNADANRGSNEQQFRLQRTVTNTAQKVLDKVAEKVDDTVNALEIMDADSAASDSVVAAKNLVTDAKNSKQLLSDIYGLAMEKAAGENSLLQDKINKMAADVDQMVCQHLKDSTSAMMRNAEAQCSNMFEEIKTELQASSEERSLLPENSIRDHILKSVGTEVVNKVSELNLAIATLISDKVTDSLLAALSQSNINLTEQLNRCKNRPKSELSYQESDSIGHASDDIDEAVDSFVSLPPNDSDHHEMAQDKLLPVMRKERAQSIAKRRQRPDATNVTQEETKPKLSRTGDSPKQEIKEDISPEVTSEKTVEIKTEIKEEASEETAKAEEAADIVTPQEEEKTIETEEEKMETSTDDTKLDGPVEDDIFGELAEPAETKALDHVTKGRPRGPTRRQRKAPSRRAQAKEENSVDGFFQNNVSNTDFNEVPTLEEEEEIKRKERIEAKMSAKKLPGMGVPQFSPEMLKLKKKPENSDESSPSTAEEVPVVSSKSPPPERSPRRPKGGMVVPGMGFGGNIMAEMKLKKLSRKSQDNLEVKSPVQEKPESKKSDFTFGPSMLRKRSEEVKEETTKNNNNNNNNNNSASLPIKNKFFSKIKPKSEKDSAKEPEKSEASPKVKPLLPPSKPLVNKPKPPPPSSKPKPALLRPDGGAKTRPLSEFFEAKAAAATSKFRARSASVEKDENIKLGK